MPAVRQRLVVTVVTILALVGAATVVPALAEPDAAAPADPVAPVPTLDPEPPGYDVSPLSILGPTRVDAAGLVAAYRASGHAARLTVPLPELARIFVEEGERYGVRADLAWVQSLVETGWFAYPGSGQVRVADNNFAGIGAYDGGHRGFAYPDARTGVRAQMQLLRQYAAGDPVPDALVHAPASKQGIAPTWLDMGNGNWATSTRYASTVLRVYAQLLEVTGTPLLAPPPPAVARAGDGLWLAGADGHVYDVGDARFWGSVGGRPGDFTVVGIAATPTSLGYWLVTAAGDVGAFGDAVRWGSARGRLPGRVVAIAAAPRGSGYWVADDRGHVAAFGQAAAMAPAPGRVAADARIVALAPTPSGRGYWLADTRGRVVAVGDATDFGGLDAAPGGDPVVDLAATPWGDGYWLVTGSGQVTAFGAAEDLGGLADDEPDGPARIVVGLRPTYTGAGYWLVSADGHVAGRGDAADFGDVPLLGKPVLDATARLDRALPARPAGDAADPNA